MSKRTRARRRKLKAHDRGYDRHNKGLSVLKKAERRRIEWERQHSG